MKILLDLWRAAFGRVEFPAATQAMTELLSDHIPVDLLLVRCFMKEEGLVETLATGIAGDLPSPQHALSSCTERERALVEQWLMRGKASTSGKASPEIPPHVVPSDLRGHLVAAPLSIAPDEWGVLVAASRPSRPYSEAHVSALDEVLEPFQALLRSHIRLQQAERRREAAEAERRALLARLNRTEIVEEIIGSEGTLRFVMEQVDKVASTNAPVLILGETGTGKEVIARAIHARSTRSEGPVVRVNCAAIPAELVDSELFGHEKGSFTGATESRKGWFERAHGGTLFLDEIAELPLAAQVRLLRIVQDGSFERVGGQKPLTADVRILAATHQDMEHLVADGRFREDLWYRISVFPIFLPPLRARQEDFAGLVQHFSRNAGLRLGGEPLSASSEDMGVLRSYPWPGNVRELAAVIERAAILGGGRRLDIAGAMNTKLYAMDKRKEEMAAGSEDRPLASIDQAMARHIERALRRTQGRIEGPQGAAELLNINPNTLRGRMRRLGVDWAAFRRDA